MIDDDPELLNPYAAKPPGKDPAPTEAVPKADSPENQPVASKWTTITANEPLLINESLQLNRRTGCFDTVVTFFCSLMLCAAILWSGSRDNHNPDIDNDDRQEQREDESPEPPRPSDDIKGARLVFVYERTAPTVDQVEALREYNEETLVAMGMIGFAAIDDNDDAPAAPFITWANGRGIPIPGVFLLKDKVILRGAKFEGSDDVKGLLGG